MLQLVMEYCLGSASDLLEGKSKTLSPHFCFTSVRMSSIPVLRAVCTVYLNGDGVGRVIGISHANTSAESLEDLGDVRSFSAVHGPSRAGTAKMFG
jgi:hypothetical protein